MRQLFFKTLEDIECFNYKHLKQSKPLKIRINNTVDQFYLEVYDLKPCATPL